MDHLMREDAQQIIREAIHAVQPDAAVHRALQNQTFSGRIVLVAAGKAAWQMAQAAFACLGAKIDAGVVVTKYGHLKGPISNFTCFEAGHPLPDENSFRGTQAAIDLVQDLSPKDTVLFLLSGGGSALFEKPLIPMEELQDITNQLLACGANIIEINTIRKRLSAVKGGRFAKICAPARVVSIVLSDILGDPLDMIASGPTCPDPSTCAHALAVAKKYHLQLTSTAQKLLQQETPKALDNIETQITGSVRELCNAAANSCQTLGYTPFVLTDLLCCHAKEAGSFLASIARTHSNSNRSIAFIAGGETIVQLTGSGKGGRNQELVVSAVPGIADLDNVVIFSVGSDGTDGPTDAAGGIVDGKTYEKLVNHGLSIHQILKNNDAYTALSKVDGLLFTGPTGTNVNDISVVLIRPASLQRMVPM